MQFPRNGTHTRGQRDNLPSPPKLNNGLTIRVRLFRGKYDLSISYLNGNSFDSVSNQSYEEAKAWWDKFFANNGTFPNKNKLVKAKRKNLLPRDFDI